MSYFQGVDVDPAAISVCPTEDLVAASATQMIRISEREIRGETLVRRAWMLAATPLMGLGFIAILNYVFAVSLPRSLVPYAVVAGVLMLLCAPVVASQAADCSADAKTRLNGLNRIETELRRRDRGLADR